MCVKFSTPSFFLIISTCICFVSVFLEVSSFLTCSNLSGAFSWMQLLLLDHYEMNPMFLVTKLQTVHYQIADRWTGVYKNLGRISDDVKRKMPNDVTGAFSQERFISSQNDVWSFEISQFHYSVCYFNLYTYFLF